MNWIIQFEWGDKNYYPYDFMYIKISHCILSPGTLTFVWLSGNLSRTKTRELVWTRTPYPGRVSLTSVMPNYQATEGYGRCASTCLGFPGSVSFNWKAQTSSSNGHCQCLRHVFKYVNSHIICHLEPLLSSVAVYSINFIAALIWKPLSAGVSCSDPSFDKNTFQYGNGLLKFHTIPIGGKDVAVCQLVEAETGNTANYVTVRARDNVSNELVYHCYIIIGIAYII